MTPPFYYGDLRPGDVVVLLGVLAFMVISVEPCEGYPNLITLTELRLWWPKGSIVLSSRLMRATWNKDTECGGKLIARGDDR